jgi:hypothetical protein
MYQGKAATKRMQVWFPNYVYNDMLEIKSILTFEGASVAEHISYIRMEYIFKYSVLQRFICYVDQIKITKLCYSSTSLDILHREALQMICGDDLGFRRTSEFVGEVLLVF